jgi:hypothetical protein
MPSSRAQLFAAAVLALVGGLLAVTALAIVVARVVVDLGLAIGRTWAPRIARWVTGIAVATGLLGLVLLIAANGPVPSTQVAGASDPEGFAILSAFVCLYAWAAVALRIPEEPRRPIVIAAAA